MTKHDRLTTGIFAMLAIAICAESVRLKLGTLSNPGPGLVPFASGVVLAVSAIVAFGQTLARDEQRLVLWGPETQWGKMIAVIASLLAYGLLIQPLGFLLVTFLWLAFMCRGVGGIGWRGTLLISVIATLACYLLFERYLGILFPLGVWRS